MFKGENNEPETTQMSDAPQPKPKVSVTLSNDDEVQEKLKVGPKIMKKRNRPSQMRRKKE